MPQYCWVDYSDGTLRCVLPITGATSKVRVLRGGEFVATRRDHLREGDVVEWQISYLENHDKMVELAKLVELAYRNRLLEKEELEHLLSEVTGNTDFFAARYSIDVAAGNLPHDFHGFRVLKKTVPVLQKETEGVEIWIELRHKQRAVGFQSMLFLRIPITCVAPNLVGQTAGRNQIVTWQPSAPILLDTVRAFSIASQKHRNDMIDILTRIVRP